MKDPEAPLPVAEAVADVVARHRRVLQSLGLPTTYRGGAWDDLLVAMRRIFHFFTHHTALAQRHHIVRHATGCRRTCHTRHRPAHRL